MTRGRHPERALEKAEKIAKRRGLVHFYKRGPGLLTDFSITTREVKAEVKIKRMCRIRVTLQGLEREAAEELAGPGSIPLRTRSRASSGSIRPIISGGSSGSWITGWLSLPATARSCR